MDEKEDEMKNDGGNKDQEKYKKKRNKKVAIRKHSSCLLSHLWWLEDH